MTISLVRETNEMGVKKYYVTIDEVIVQGTECEYLSNAMHYYDVHKGMLLSGKKEKNIKVEPQSTIVLMQEKI